MDSEDLSESQAVESVVHALAQRTSALLALSRRLILPEGVPEDNELRKESLYRLLKWRFENGEISPQRLLELTEVVLRENVYFDVLVQNLIGYFTRDEEIKVRKQPTQLVPLLEEVVDLFDFLAAEKCITLSLLIPDEPMLKIDRDLIHRLLVNIIDNAIKYSYSGTPGGKNRVVSILCRRHSVEGSVRISVSSFGVGILEEELLSGAIFNYGVRGSLARDRERRGMGIGLAEAKKIAEAHGGSIDVTSKHQHGEAYLTSVAVVLPAA